MIVYISEVRIFNEHLVEFLVSTDWEIQDKWIIT